jgi:MFS family permease
VDTDAILPLARYRGFVRFWYARVTGTTASQMLMVAVGWQMYELTSSAWDLGMIGLYQFAPALVLTLPAGHLADRVHRGRIVGACFVVQAVTAAVLTHAAWQHWATRELLLALSVLLGVVRAFQMPAQQSLTPLLVPALALPRAMAVSMSGLQIAIIGGPALAGAIFLAGTTAVYATCTALSATACVLVLRVRYDHSPPPAEPPSLRTLLAGLHFIVQRPAVLGAISLDLFAVLLGGATALLPMFAKDILHVGTVGLGLLRAGPAAGALAMSIVLAHRPFERRVGRTLLAAVGVYGIATLVFGVSTNFYLSLTALAVTGAADMVNVVIRQSLVQLETPNAMRGRVSAVSSIFIGASNQLGEFESGATAEWWGPVASVVVGGVGTIVVALAWLRLFPTLARRDRVTSA